MSERAYEWSERSKAEFCGVSERSKRSEQSEQCEQTYVVSDRVAH